MAESEDGVGPDGRRFEILERRRVHDGFYRFDLLRLRHERFDGGWSPPLSRELLIQREAVVVLPYDPVHDLVVLIEQFRTGPIDHPGSPWLIEAPAGIVDREGEDHAAVAVREVKEETGLAVLQLYFACHYRGSPGGTSELAHVYVAAVDLAEAQAGVFGLAHEHEDIRTHIVPAEDAFAWVEEGRIVAATGLVPLLWLQLHRDRLRREWRQDAA